MIDEIGIIGLLALFVLVWQVHKAGGLLEFLFIAEELEDEE